MDPASTVVLSFLLSTVLLPWLIYFCSLQTPIYSFCFFCPVCGVSLFLTQNLSILFYFYSFLCTLNDLDLFLSNLSLMTIFTPCSLCRNTFKSGEEPHAVSAAWMCSHSLLNEFRKNKHLSPQVFSFILELEKLPLPLTASQELKCLFLQCHGCRYSASECTENNMLGSFPVSKQSCLCGSESFLKVGPHTPWMFNIW